MKKAGNIFILSLLLLLLFLSSFPVNTASSYYEVSYPPSTGKGELVFGATYRMWIPEGVATLRGIIVHQHGCGPGAANQGRTAVDDLHWQALARKWDCALLGPYFMETEDSVFRLKEECRMWSVPGNGSSKTFLRALKDLGSLSGHPELKKIPWALWGHSGGGGWVGRMLALYPERIAAVWFQSGIPNPSASSGFHFPERSRGVPCMLNLGEQERKHERFGSLFRNGTKTFLELRKAGALIGYVVDPLTGHECGNARYLAIPFFDVCLAKRLPLKAGEIKLRDMPGGITRPIPSLPETKIQAWLPNGEFAEKWKEYFKTGYVTDITSPPAPRNLKISDTGEIFWTADADLESGLSGFLIERDGVEIVRMLGEGKEKTFGKSIWQRESYGDTPIPPLPEMRFTDRDFAPDAGHVYQVSVINTSGLMSTKATATGNR